MCNCSVIVHRFVFPAKSMPVVLMEHNWNVFQRMGGQHWVLLTPPAQYRNPICLESIINEGTAAAARQCGDTWLVATLATWGTWALDLQLWGQATLPSLLGDIPKALVLSLSLHDRTFLALSEGLIHKFPLPSELSQLSLTHSHLA